MAYKKGETGNPNGRPKGAANRASEEIRELIDSKVDMSKVIEKLFELSQGVEIAGEDSTYTKPPDAQAAKILMEYRYGKARQQVDLTSDDEPLPVLVGFKVITQK